MEDAPGLNSGSETKERRAHMIDEKEYAEASAQCEQHVNRLGKRILELQEEYAAMILRKETLTEKLTEKYAIKMALGNNGGEWSTHYTTEQKNVWRKLARELIEEVEYSLSKAGEASVDYTRSSLACEEKVQK